jgi:DNA-binding winged helix-turn-helix (wHTH) protein/tetratricopeptide (TPR) repeat protein
MSSTSYRFGAFRLDAQARELFEHERRIELPLSTTDCLIYLIRHRDRPIGRDELASAVWGRIDVSEVSLSHAIMRLRRVLGDDGNAQRIIRTVPRLGYRWVMDIETESEPAGGPVATVVAPSTPLPETADATTPIVDDTPQQPDESPAPVATFKRRRWLAFVIAMLVVAAVLAAWIETRAPTQRVRTSVPADSALVLPVSISAGPESSWLRLGLMDLIATQLRRSGLATPPSETVAALLERHAAEPAFDARDELPAAWQVRSTATLTNGIWTVQLEANGVDRALAISAQADDALKAARNAADELLIKLGHTPPNDDFGDAELAKATLRLRVNAAVWSGQLDIARRVIEQAAPSLQASPEIKLSKALVTFYGGDYQSSREQAEELLAQLPAQTSPVLRARVLNTIGAATFRQGDIDNADRVYTESAQLLQNANEPNTLAKAWLGRAGAASQRLQLDLAAADYGRARTLLEISNDAFGVVTVDLNLGMIALQRGQPAIALPLLQTAAERFGAFGAEDALAATQSAMIETQLDLLDTTGALATSAGFAAPDAQGSNPRRRWELTLARARVLRAVGRLGEAETLLTRILDASDPKQDAIVRAQANALAAAIALDRDEPAKAAELAASALTPTIEACCRDQYPQIGLLQIGALQRGGRLDAAADELARLRAWCAQTPDAAADIGFALADAEQSAARGQSAAALRFFADAMQRASARGVPEELVRVGLPYVRALIADGKLDDAVSVNGRIAPWAGQDMRAAWSEALVYSALGKSTAAAAALERARRLAGERNISDVVTARH